MAEARKPVARIQVPVRQAQSESVRQAQGESVQQGQSEPIRQVQGGTSSEQVSPDSAQGVHLLMSKGRPVEKRDPWIVPMVGLLLAFSVISLIVQLLIAFS